MLGLSKEEFERLKQLQREYNMRVSRQLEIVEAQLTSEWGGSLRCITSDGRNVNIADELNKSERCRIAQLAEHRTLIPGVEGSSPSPTKMVT